ncbi:MAG: hypothetical protein HN348_34385, partial [Proteobacteria bacterium]|nr:hypothetical protein [Pseudomonadota bacterium]
KDNAVFAAEPTALTKEARICAAGRFVLPQIIEHSSRLPAHMIRIPDGLRHSSYEETVAMAAEELGHFSGDQFAMVTHPGASREEIHVLRQFTKEVMKSENFIIADEPSAIPSTVKIAFAAGNLLDAKTVKGLAVTIIADIIPTEAVDLADVVFRATMPTETPGTILCAGGKIGELAVGKQAPAEVVADWQIVADIAAKMGASGFDFDNVAHVTAAIDASAEEAPPMPAPLPQDDLQALPKSYRGHSLIALAPALKNLYCKGHDKEPVEKTEGPFEIMEKVEPVPNTHMVTIHAPTVAAKCQAGQFVIAMTDEKSERIPYTVADWDREKGTVTIHVLEAGRSSREMALMQKGEHLAHFAGPLGNPIEVKRYGTVVCGGGCYGVAGIMPLARALKEAGNKVICINEASSSYLVYWEDELRQV